MYNWTVVRVKGITITQQFALSNFTCHHWWRLFWVCNFVFLWMSCVKDTMVGWWDQKIVSSGNALANPTCLLLLMIGGSKLTQVWQVLGIWYGQTRDSSIGITAGQTLVVQLSFLSLTQLAVLSHGKANWQLSPVWSTRNHIHCKMPYYGIIVMHLTRHTGICKSAWWRPIEQLSLLSLSEILIPLQGDAKWQFLVPSFKP